MAERQTLVQKLNSIYEIVDHINKNGFNTKQNYKFVRAADLAHAVRNAFAKVGIYAEVNFEWLRGYEFNTTGGSKMQAVDVKCKITFHDIDDPTATYTATGLGSGSDGLDKAAFKAQTGALKYALRNAFIVPDEADPENDSNEEEEELQQRSAPKLMARAPQKPALKVETTKTVEKKSEPVKTAPPASGPTSEIPKEEELESLRSRFTTLVADLSQAGLANGKGMPQAKKVLAYVMKTTDATNPKNITRGQWAMFFDIVKAIYPAFETEGNDPRKDPNVKKLINLVDEASEKKSGEINERE